MPLVNPNKKETKKFNPNVDNTEIYAQANSAGKVITYISFILILPLIFYIIKRNNLVKLQMKINEATSGINIQLKKRKNTLVKLINAVKGEMKFEKETLTQITQLRSAKTKDSQKLMDLTNKLASSINIGVEAYPNLKSAKLVQKLMESSSDIENEIAASRRLYNAYVNQFNTEIFVWPSSVIATGMKLHKISLFSASEEDKKDVNIDL